MSLFDDRVFEEGQVVVATYVDGYALTAGREYTVVRYEPRYHDVGFTWPAYVTVVGDEGRQVICHTHRFRALDTEKGEVK